MDFYDLVRNLSDADMQLLSQKEPRVKSIERWVCREILVCLSRRLAADLMKMGDRACEEDVIEMQDQMFQQMETFLHLNGDMSLPSIIEAVIGAIDVVCIMDSSPHPLDNNLRHYLGEDYDDEQEFVLPSVEIFELYERATHLAGALWNILSHPSTLSLAEGIP